MTITKVHRLVFLISVLMITSVVSAQLRYDSSVPGYSYTCNCAESIILQGQSVEVQQYSKKYGVTIFQIMGDTVFYQAERENSPCNYVYVVSNNEQTNELVRQSNLFVLRLCYYLDGNNPSRRRPLVYYTLVEAVNNPYENFNLIGRHKDFPACVQCQAIRPYRGRERKKQYSDFDRIEKFILKRQNKVCSEKR